MNKRIIRVIIYEGDEELVDAYAANSLNHTQESKGHPKWFNTPKIEGKQIFITGATLNSEVGLFQVIEKHNSEVKKKFIPKGIDLKIKHLAEPILNQLNTGTEVDPKNSVNLTDRA